MLLKETKGYNTSTELNISSVSEKSGFSEHRVYEILYPLILLWALNHIIYDTNSVSTLPSPAGGCKVARFTVSGTLTIS